VNPRAGLDCVEKGRFLTLPGLGLRPLGHPAGSQSLYRLSYPDSSHTASTPKRRNNTHAALVSVFTDYRFFILFFSFFVVSQRNVMYKYNYV
jgi:hypothetical protein